MNIGEVIKCRRQKRGITQAELAALLNITPQAVSRWEMGISYPDIAMIPKISEALWVTADELLGVDPTKVNRGQELKLPESEPLDTERISKDYTEVPLSQNQVDDIFQYVPVPISGESKKVLVVDDADFMRMMLEDILMKHGHTVLQARNGQEGLDILEREKADVCVLDIVMPVMHGIEALRRMKEMQPDLKVVMLSALSQESNVRKALHLGAAAFVAKPFQAETLVERIG